MSENEWIFGIPYGTRDLMPQEAQEKRHVEAALMGLFRLWGYDEIATPAIEYLDTLTMGNGRCLEPQMFKLFAQDNRTLALRHEMTTPIARLVASRMREESLPLKLAYISNVFRSEQAQAGRQCEFNQGGVELIGTSAVAADAEVIALAIEGIRAAGLQDFQVCLGQVDFISGMMRQMHFTKTQQERVTCALERHDLVELAAIVEETDLPAAAKEGMKRIPTLHGKKDVLHEAYSIVLNEQGRRALDNLSEIYRLLQEYGVAEYVSFDLGVIRDLNYYTGMVFEAYAPGMGYPICGATTNCLRASAILAPPRVSRWASSACFSQRSVRVKSESCHPKTATSPMHTTNCPKRCKRQGNCVSRGRHAKRRFRRRQSRRPTSTENPRAIKSSSTFHETEGSAIPPCPHSASE